MKERFKKVPGLRQDLIFEKIEGNKKYAARLIDPVLKLAMKLDSRSLIVAMHLEKEQTFSSLKEKIGKILKIGDDVLLKILDFLDRFHFLNTEETEKYIREKLNLPAKKLPVIIPDDLFYRCTGCGACCGFHNIGPVEKEVIDNLNSKEGKEFRKRHDIPDSFVFTLKPKNEDKDGGIKLFHLRHNRCLFLDTSGHCLIHNELGYDKKPLVCRLFPYHFTKTPEGIVVGLQMECRDYFNAKELGKKISREEFKKEVLTLIELLDEKYAIFKVREPIPIDYYQSMTYEEYKSIENEFLSELNRFESNSFIKYPEFVSHFFKTHLGGKLVKIYEKDENRYDIYDFIEKLVKKINDEIDIAKGGEDEFVYSGIEEVKQFAGAIENLPIFADMIKDFKISGRKEELLKDFYKNFFYNKEPLFYKNFVYGVSILLFNTVVAAAVAFFKAGTSKRFLPTDENFLDGFILANYFTRHKTMKWIYSTFSDEITNLFLLNFSDTMKLLNDSGIEDRKPLLFYF